VLDAADTAYRVAFLDAVNAFLAGIDEASFAPLAAIERLKWHLVRRRALDELLEVVRFQREELPGRAPVRVGARWYGDFPFRSDARLAIPPEVYRVPAPWRRLVPEPLKRLVRGVLGRRPA
jgi:CDP-glycerol glycerophosphotransferase